MPTDEFGHQKGGLESPARRWFAITPHDTNELAEVPRSIYIGSDGDIVLEDEVAGQVTFAVTAGAILPVRPYKVLATGTTVTQIIGLI